MGYPSMHVAAAAGVPGVEMRIALISPPCMAPTYTPSKTMRAAIGGSIWYVKGTRSAMVIVAVRPGSAPAMMPTVMPIIIIDITLNVRIIFNASIKVST